MNSIHFRNRILRKIARSLLVAALALPAPAMAAAQARSQAAQPRTPAAAQPAVPASAFRDHAAQAGITRCSNLYQALGQVLTVGSSYAVNSQWDDKAPNARSVQGVVGMTYNLPDYKTQAAGVVTATPAAQGCEGNMVRVAPFQQPCAQVVAKLPTGSSKVADLSGIPLYQLGGNGGQALLVASGASCIVVSIASLAG